LPKSFRTRTDTLPKAKALRRDMTAAEKKLWLHLRNRQLSDAVFRKQVPIGPYIADFCCLKSRLVIEIDGGQHDESKSDAVRDAWLIKNGYRVLRVWNNDVTKNIEGVLLEIAAALAQVKKDRD
jgi:very-short-patch-repair endonuclease